MQRLWIFSDLHLTEPSEYLYRSFLQALDEPELSDTVVFAGDIFDLFVGNSARFSSKNAPFFNQLAKLHLRGVKLFYIEGNHDFHLKEILEPHGVQVVKDEITLTTERKKRIYIAHGDLVDQTDVNYLRLRKIFRSPVLRTLVDVAPGSLIETIAGKLSRPLSQQHSELPEKWQPEDREKLRKKYRNFARQKTVQGGEADVVILGHCHDLDELPPFYWNMGYPPQHRQFLFYDAATNEVKRREFPRIS